MIYRRAIEYCVMVYKFTTELPTDEKYGLISQIKRAVVSIALNISEGAGSQSKKEFALFVSYAYRSCNEVLACLELIFKLSLCKDKDKIVALEKEGGELSRMIYAFLSKLDKRDSFTYDL